MLITVSVIGLCILTHNVALSYRDLANSRWKNAFHRGTKHLRQINNALKNLPKPQVRGRSSVNFPKQFLETKFTTQSPPTKMRMVQSCQCVDTALCDPETGRIINYGIGKVDFRGADDACLQNEICCLPPDEPQEGYFKPNEGNQNYQSNTAFRDCGIVTDLYSSKGNTLVLRTQNFANERIATDQGQFPWTLVLVIRTKDADIYKCAASLLNETIAITAAHCVEKQIAGNLVLKAGEWDLELDGEIIHPQQRIVKNIRFHPYYSRRPIMYDVALLEVDAPFEHNALVNNICLPEETDWFGDKECYAAGWYVQGNGTTMDDRKLKKAKMSIVSNADCEAIYKRPDRFGRLYKLHSSFICASGENGEDTCKGDGGGPLACAEAESERYYLAGITSWGYDCGTTPGAYSDVVGLIEWIKDTMNEILNP